MELRSFALWILEANSLEGKFFFPEKLSDDHPGPALIINEPLRPKELCFQRHERSHKLPSFQEHKSKDKRAICLHRFAGHELLAVEMMAWAILAFPNAPKKYRMALAHQLHEEQFHTKLYITRLAEMNMKFGNEPLFRHFWNHIPYIQSIQNFISCMNLTFEQANLDFASLYSKSFEIAGDLDSAKLMQTILRDEIRHVRLGVNWLSKLKEKHQTLFESWKCNLPKTIKPEQSKGFVMHKSPRIKSGISEEWLNFLEQKSNKS